MSRRKICIVTGSRAEYGLLYWLIKEVQDDPEIELQLVVTGMHLSPEFGLTYKTIVKDGFLIADTVEMLLSSDSAVGVTKSLGLGTIGFADTFARLRPDIVVLLGDRFEILAAAQAALIAKIPIAHLHGGEITEGAIDESIRHAITKMAYIHFVAAEPYRKRVIQLGEDPKRVFTVGFIGIDNINNLQLLDRNSLEKELAFNFGKTSFLVTYHPATLGRIAPQEAIKELLLALESFPDARIIFTKPNADQDGRLLAQLVDDYIQKHENQAIVFDSLGQVRYLSLLKHTNLVLGNSSSGLSEAPFFGTPTVNVGERQRGRLRWPTVIDCDENAEAIRMAIRKALSEEFAKNTETFAQIQKQESISRKIKDKLKKIHLNEILVKKFYDIDFIIKAEHVEGE
ncbi:MAG: UDP-N-acetylglucosamine 2-epimerase [Desulfitobacteriaceae bacterium]|nr:UDP-N-acetylglucosamine 2-epimerase [Desulfitobacteriaceae bacterium]MDI6879454.1 UDP-N-acetylglucosamine 2-epimerase [Desulfitobacteriaceae bacterium]MDI6912952.1 UDP-N-acetylglucosamine 2-epimerase [Desulfitobacteriaceae bacterium]